MTTTTPQQDSLRERAQQEAERRAAVHEQQQREDLERRELAVAEEIEQRKTRMLERLKRLGIEVVREDLRLLYLTNASGNTLALAVTVDGYEIVEDRPGNHLNAASLAVARQCAHCHNRQMSPLHGLTDLLAVPDAYDCGCTVPLADQALTALQASDEHSERAAREEKNRWRSDQITAFRSQVQAVLDRSIPWDAVMVGEEHIEAVVSGMTLRYIESDYGQSGVMAVLGACDDCGTAITTYALRSLVDLGDSLRSFQKDPRLFHRCPQLDIEQPVSTPAYQPSPLAQLGQLLADALYEAGYELRQVE